MTLSGWVIIAILLVVYIALGTIFTIHEIRRFEKEQKFYDEVKKSKEKREIKG